VCVCYELLEVSSSAWCKKEQRRRRYCSRETLKNSPTEKFLREAALLVGKELEDIIW